MEVKDLNTSLAVEALENMKRFKIYTTDEEFQEFEKGIKQFDTDLNGSGFEAIQAKSKLEEIKKLDGNGFTAVMFAYFGKTPKDFV